MNPAERSQFVAQRLRVTLGCAAVLLVALLYAPHAWSGPVLCPLHGVLGLPCPACGLTRALTALLHGDLVTALWWNALSFPVAALLLLAPLVAVAELAAGRRFPVYGFLYSQRVAAIAAACVISYHLVRTVVWHAHGVLVEQFFRTSWSYRLYELFRS